MTGAFIWLDDRSAQVGGAGWASASTVDQATGRVFFAVASNDDVTGANSVHAVMAATGRPLWSVTSTSQVAGGLGHWADPVVTNGVVYVGSCGPNHKVLACTDVGSLFYSAGWARSSNPREYRQDDHYRKTPDAFVRSPFSATVFATGSPWHHTTESSR